MNKSKNMWGIVGLGAGGVGCSTYIATFVIWRIKLPQPSFLSFHGNLLHRCIGLVLGSIVFGAIGLLRDSDKLASSLALLASWTELVLMGILAGSW